MTSSPPLDSAQVPGVLQSSHSTATRSVDSSTAETSWMSRISAAGTTPATCHRTRRRTSSSRLLAADLGATDAIAKTSPVDTHPRHALNVVIGPAPSTS